MQGSVKYQDFASFFTLKRFVEHTVSVTISRRAERDAFCTAPARAAAGNLLSARGRHSVEFCDK